jgi:formate dehydrogenase maturation protein FdhE
MSLSDRLQKARTQQLIEAGLVPQDHGREPEPEPEPELVLDALEPDAAVDESAEGLFSPIIIEAQPVGLHLVAQPIVDLTERVDDENSAVCPTCNSVGVADMVDLVGHTVHYTCATCSTMWRVRREVVSESTVR